MYMLDTDICSYIIRERPVSVLEKFKRLEASDLCISVITEAELLYGVARTNSKKITADIVQNFLRRLVIFEWDGAAAKHYSLLRADMEKKGKPIGNMDLMIAAHALSISATIVTNNTRHFTIIPKLKVANWV